MPIQPLCRYVCEIVFEKRNRGQSVYVFLFLKYIVFSERVTFPPAIDKRGCFRMNSLIEYATKISLIEYTTKISGFC